MGGPLKRYVYIYEISLLLGKGGFVYMPQLVSCMRGAFALNVGCRIYEFRHRSEFSVVKNSEPAFSGRRTFVCTK